MGADESAPKGFTLGRWSRRKLEAARGAQPAPPPDPPLAPHPIAVVAAPIETPAAAAPLPEPADGVALPRVETLSFDSDFTAFLQPKVDEALKRQALKQLFRDPRFNVMDGLDVYIDDYSICEPVPPDVVGQLVQGRYVFDPPATRVNEHGVVEDVAPDAAAPAGGDEVPVPAAAAEAEAASPPVRQPAIAAAEASFADAPAARPGEPAVASDSATADCAPSREPEQPGAAPR